MTSGEKCGQKYWFSPNVPDEVKSSCKDLLIANEYLIPTWCNEVRIFWNAEGEPDAAAYIETSYSYRCASITICPPFLSEEPEDRELRIRHELCHIVSAPLVSYARSLANIFGADDDNIKALVDRESSEKVESMTEDLVFILQQMERTFEKKFNKN
jgi:hypothetical protein